MVRAGLAGAALGVLAFVAGSLILYEAGGVLPAAGGTVATFAAALAAGVWAGVPGARHGTPPTGRWIAAGAAVETAGLFAIGWGLYGGERFGPVGRALALLLLVGIPVYAIGFLLPGLVAWGEPEPSEEDDGRTAVGAGVPVVLAVLGGIAGGAIAAGLFLLPAVSPGLLLVGSGALLFFPLFFPHETRGAEPEEVLLHIEDTPYGTLRVTETIYPGRREPERRLYQDEEIESGELARSGAPAFAYIAAAERWLDDTTPRGARYLFLGGGAYTLPRRVAERDVRARITVVELDPAVTRAAYRFFGLRPEHGVVSLHGDARRVAEALPAGEWDRVVLDVYGGSETVPPHLVTREAMAVCRRLLAADGVLLVNVIGTVGGEGECRFWSTVHTVADAFPAVALYAHLGPDFPERQNFLLAAAPEPGFSFPVRAGAFDPWPAAEWPELPCITVFRDRTPPSAGASAAPPEGGGHGGRIAEPAEAD